MSYDTHYSYIWLAEVWVSESFEYAEKLILAADMKE